MLGVGLCIHANVKLVSAAVAAAVLGVTEEKVYALADSELLWVFDVSSNHGRARELRFWTKELENPKAVAALTLDQVVREIVPRRDAIPGQFCGLRNWEVGNLLRTSRATLIALRDDLAARPRADGGVMVARPALELFLRARWCGNYRD